MYITADQSRAGRALLNWTQDQLATNARVSRATIADFENNARKPQTNNLRSMAECMFAAGIAFIDESDNSGAGVRFRERKLEYCNSVKVERLDRRAIMRMRYAGEDFQCLIDLDAVDDYHRANFSSDDEYSRAISEMLHVILSKVEQYALTHIQNGQFSVTSSVLGLP
jgi:transcriptional regulator with XRE-family HTH domain